jgi:hypothetical protein
MSYPPYIPSGRNDRVAILVDFNSYYCNEDEATLMGLEDYIRCYEFPNELTGPKNTIAGFVGDPVYIRVPFWIDATPSGGGFLESCTISIVAEKSGEDDFILEQKEFNTANLIRNEGLDTSTKAYYELQYGLVLRYEDWIEVIQIAEGLRYAVFENVENVTEYWNNYQAENWDLKLKIQWNVTGVQSGNTTEFNAETTITCNALGSAADDGETFTGVVQYYTSGNVEVNSILKDEDTYILATFTGDTTILPSGYDDFYGYIFQDTVEGGSVFTRRFANSEYDSEDTTPFTAGPDPGDALTTRADGNVRISVYVDKIVLSTIYSNEQQEENNNRSHIGYSLIYTRIGYKRYFCPILNEDGTIMLSEILEAILNEECP